jgi:hypothetical protein
MNGYNEFCIRNILTDITAKYWPEQLSPDFNAPARPAYLSDPEFRTEPFPTDARPSPPTTPKDWSKLGR